MNPLDLIAAAIALFMAGTILVRVVCVLHQTSPSKHRNRLLFLGFGYSYIVLGAGAICAAIAIGIDHHTYADTALWLMLAGSCGLIIFDRRARRCWTVTDCPIQTQRDKLKC